MSIKDLFKSVENETIENEVEETEEKNGSEIEKLFPKALENASNEEITEDLTGKTPEEWEAEENAFGADVVLYPPKGDELSWQQTFKTEAGNCTVSLSSKIALETMQLDEHDKEKMLEKTKNALKVYHLPNEQEGFISRTSLIESNLTTPEKVIVVRDPSEEVVEDVEAFASKVMDAGGLVVDTPEEAARYVSSYLV